MAEKPDSNSSVFAVRESSGPSAGPSDYDMAYQNYIASAYVRAMYEKRYREMSETAIEELSELMIEAREEIKKRINIKDRVNDAIFTLESIKSYNEVSTVGLSAEEVYIKGTAVMEKMLKSVEGTLNQLPIENGVNFSENDAEKLDSIVELLTKNFEECLSGLESAQESWVQFADIVQDISQKDLLLCKKRCDDLMKNINESMLKLSSLRAAKTAKECLSH